MTVGGDGTIRSVESKGKDYGCPNSSYDLALGIDERWKKK